MAIYSKSYKDGKDTMKKGKTQEMLKQRNVEIASINVLLYQITDEGTNQLDENDELLEKFFINFSKPNSTANRIIKILVENMDWLKEIQIIWADKMTVEEKKILYDL